MNFYENNNNAHNQLDESTAISNIQSVGMHQPQVPFPQSHPAAQMPFSIGSTASIGSGITSGDYLLESTNRTKNFLNELITPQGLAQLQVTLGPLQG